MKEAALFSSHRNATFHSFLQEHAALTDFVSGNRSGGRPGKGWQMPAQTRASPSEPSQCPAEEPKKKILPCSSGPVTSSQADSLKPTAFSEGSHTEM